ncbi:hypothetical protein NL676_014254 [Syzygium grande]|nr:hypothetical protein NL676_014254 [Syzygium grande]
MSEVPVRFGIPYQIDRDVIEYPVGNGDTYIKHFTTAWVEVGEVDPQCQDGDLASPDYMSKGSSSSGRRSVIWEVDEFDSMDIELAHWDFDEEPMESDEEPEPIESDEEPYSMEVDSEEEPAETEFKMDSMDFEDELSDSSSESSGSNPDWVP